jgi:hypothetical protein
MLAFLSGLVVLPFKLLISEFFPDADAGDSRLPYTQSSTGLKSIRKGMKVKHIVESGLVRLHSSFAQVSWILVESSRVGVEVT